MSHKKGSQKNTKGFTLVELLIATSVFSVVLLLVTTGVIRIGQAYYKGIIQSRTQETTRQLGEDISRTIQLANGAVKKSGSGVSPRVVCVGNTRYTYYLNEKVVNSTKGVIGEEISPATSCIQPAGTPFGPEAKQLLNENMRLLKFSIDPSIDTATADGSDRAWRVEIRTAYGDNDLLTSYDDDGSTPVGWDGSDVFDPEVQQANCKSKTGSQFCSTSQLDILVKKRLK